MGENGVPPTKNTTAPESSGEAGVPGCLLELELGELDLAPPSPTSIFEERELVLFSDEGESFCTYHQNCYRGLEQSATLRMMSAGAPTTHNKGGGQNPVRH